MRQTNVGSMVEAGIISAIAVIFALISAYVPLLGLFVTFIWPVPIILLGVRHGYKWSIMATIVSGVLIAALIQPLTAISIVIGLSLTGIVLGYCFRAGFSPQKTMLWGSIASLISTLALIAVSMLFMGVNPIAMQVDILEKSTAQAIELYRSQGMSEQDLQKMSEFMDNLISFARIMVPSTILFSAVISAYVNFAAAKAVLRKLGHHVPGFPPFKEWALPRWVLYIYILGAGLTWLGLNQSIDWLYQAGTNLRAFGTLLLLVQGLAVFYFLADKYNLSRVFRGIILLLIFITPIFNMVAIFGGAIDIALDYRGLRRPRES